MKPRTAARAIARFNKAGLYRTQRPRRAWAIIRWAVEQGIPIGIAIDRQMRIVLWQLSSGERPGPQFATLDDFALAVSESRRGLLSGT